MSVFILVGKEMTGDGEALDHGECNNTPIWQREEVQGWIQGGGYSSPSPAGLAN